MTRTDRPRVTICADDFGLSVAVNEAVEQAHVQGCLTSASLMVAGPAAADAVARARRLPGLRVGLHLVVIEGPALVPGAVVRPDGWIGSDQLGLGVRYYFDPAVRRWLRLEIAAQFAAFAATGLSLDHANAHKHMHLHPTVGRMLLQEGARYGLPFLRVPAEPPAIMAALGEAVELGDKALFQWTRLLRAQARRAGVSVNDWCFGLRWSGGMTAGRLARLLPLLPAGRGEVYFHPATRRDALLDRLMPGYQHEAELRALLAGGLKPTLRSGL